jgi:hypothetical protein
MHTVKQIQRLWEARKYQALLTDLAANRVESALRTESPATVSIAAAAMGLIRLAELGQSHVALAQTLLRTLFATQETDGGWADPMLTSLCLRALMTGNGAGLAIERGLTYLANLQKSEGAWPAEPIRRMPADPRTSAFVLYQLASDDRFRAAIQFDDAITWFDSHHAALDIESRRLWDRATLRCLRRQAIHGTAMPSLC